MKVSATSVSKCERIPFGIGYDKCPNLKYIEFNLYERFAMVGCLVTAAASDDIPSLGMSRNYYTYMNMFDGQ